MTIDEAIKELTKIVGKWQYGADNKRDNALKLGIEALNYIRICHNNPNCFKISPLTGETKE